MNSTSQHSFDLIQVLEHPAGGILGIVDSLLKACPADGFRLSWDDEMCHVLVGVDSERTDKLFAIPMRKSIVRAIIARVATLCLYDELGDISPYGGVGEITAGGTTPRLFRVQFANTLAEQRLELIPIHRAGKAQRIGFSKVGQSANLPFSPA